MLCLPDYMAVFCIAEELTARTPNHYFISITRSFMKLMKFNIHIYNKEHVPLMTCMTNA